MEASTPGIFAYGYLKEKVANIKEANPTALRPTSHSGKKTDGCDAETIISDAGTADEVWQED